MIAGEEYWINQITGQELEYDQFLGGIVKAVNPVNIIKTGGKLAGGVVKTAWNVGTAAPKAVLGLKSKKILTRKSPPAPAPDPELEQLKREKNLKRFQEVQAQQIIKKSKEKATQKIKDDQAEQAVINARYNNAKRMLLYGTISILGLGVIATAGFLLVKRQQQFTQ